MKLIDKDAVVAEIERLKTIYKDDENIHHIAKYNVLVDILLFLDTLEVKEVDLEKEIKNEIDEYWYDSDYGAIQRHGGTITMEISDVKEIAKHFFELGMQQAQKGE